MSNNPLDFLANEFDFVMAQTKGTCGGSQLYTCEDINEGAGQWIYSSGSCTGTCTDDTLTCKISDTGLVDLAESRPCHVGYFGMTESLPCSCLN